MLCQTFQTTRIRLSKKGAKTKGFDFGGLGEDRGANG